MAAVKITVRKNGPYRVEAPEGSVNWLTPTEISLIWLESRRFPCAAAAGPSTSHFAMEPTARLDFKARKSPSAKPTRQGIRSH